jgi:SAM-dependent methyltransferase
MNPMLQPSPVFAAPSDWVVRWAPLLQPESSIVDVACGHGRHAHWLSRQGHRVTAIDRDAALLEPLASFAHTCVADLEAGPWPLPGAVFAVVLVTNYLWRPLFPALLAAVAPGGLLIYETFAQAQAAIGRPKRPEFLLRPGELLHLLHDREVAAGVLAAPSETWRVIAFEEGRLPAHGDVPQREVQRVIARRGAPTSASPDFLVPPG